MFIRRSFLAALVLCLISCSSHTIVQQLDDVEILMQTRPDSAMSAIKAIDTLSVHRKSLKARYSLLYSMALDKNYIDTTNVAIVKTAVDYYSIHGSADEKLKSYYYLGRIQENRGDIKAAAISFSLGEKEIPEVTDIQMAGLLYMAFADIYNNSRNFEKEEEYVRKGIDAFDQAGDERHINLSGGRLAIVLFSKNEWDKADSLFQTGIKTAKMDTVATSVYLSNYARMKVLQPNPDPEGAIALLSKLSRDYNCQMSVMDYAVYAYALALNGDCKTARQIVTKLLELSDNETRQIYYLFAKIEQQCGDYSKALEYTNESYRADTESFYHLLEQSVPQSLQDYYEKAADDAEMNGKIVLLRTLVISIFCIIILLLYFLYAKIKRDRQQLEMDQLLRVAEESNRLLQETNLDLASHNNEIEKTLESLRKEYVFMYKEKFAAIGELCNAFLLSQNRVDKKDFIVRRVENLISYVSDNEKLHAKFESQINHDLNDIVKHLKEDLGDLSRKDSRFICYCIVGFNPEMIGTILGLSLSNVYTKKSRLKERIRGLDSPYKEDYLRML